MELVAHPETGEPVIAQTTFQPVDRPALEQAVTNTESEVNAAAEAVTNAQATLDQATADHAAKVAAHEDAKSNLSRFDEIRPGQVAETGAEDASGEVATESVEETSEPVVTEVTEDNTPVF